MANILNIETTGSQCSVSVSKMGKCLHTIEQDKANSHSGILTNFIVRCLKECGLALGEIDAIAFSEGPGSYTGLRIGLATAKGLCYALDLPLIAVSTLQAMAWGQAKLLFEGKHKGMQEAEFDLKKLGQDTGPKSLKIAPMIDARRMEVYTGLYDLDNQLIEPISALIIEGNPFTNLLEAGPILFCGNGVEKAKNQLDHRNAFFEISTKSTASDMVELSHKLFITNTFSDLAYYQPNYLKPFYTPQKKIRN